MNSKLVEFKNYVLDLIKEFTTEKLNQYAFQLSSVYVRQADGIQIACLRVNGMHYVVEAPVVEIVANDYFIDNLPPKVVRYLTMIAYMEQTIPRLKVESFGFRDGYIDLVSDLTGKRQRCKIKDLLSSKEILNELGPEDSFRLGFLSAEATRETR